MKQYFYEALLQCITETGRSLAILVDPEKFPIPETASFLKRLPKETTHLFVGGSTVHNGETKTAVAALKAHSNLPLFLFPGDHSQLTSEADAVLFLSLLSGRNAEYLVGQQIKSVPMLMENSLEVIPTGYILIDGGNESAVAQVTQTQPLDQNDLETIVNTAKAGEFMGAKLVYLEAGSGAHYPVNPQIIRKVKNALNIPVLVGGGIRNKTQLAAAYDAGADMVVIGTVFENS